MSRLEYDRKNHELRMRMLEWKEIDTGTPPPYSGAVDCPKCSSLAVGTRFCTGWDSALFLPGDKDCTKHKFEHHHRECGCCGYGWTEQTAAGYPTPVP